MDDRIVSSGFRQGDDEQEQSLRPKTLREYIGQESVKQNLHISIEAALKRREYDGKASASDNNTLTFWLRSEDDTANPVLQILHLK